MNVTFRENHVIIYAEDYNISWNIYQSINIKAMTKPNFEIIPQSVDKVYDFSLNIDDQLERCQYMTRISYKREEDETKVSPLEFVQTLINGRHYEPLEFVTIYADLARTEYFASFKDYLKKFAACGTHAHVRNIKDDIYVFTLREVIEWYDNLTPNTDSLHFDITSPFFSKLRESVLSMDKFVKVMGDLPKSERDKYIRMQFVITTNRQIGTSLTRHRTLSKNWESTRHCIYNNSRFGILRFCNPTLYNKIATNSTDSTCVDIINHLKDTTDLYMKIAETDKVQAAYILPSELAVSIAFAGFMNDIDKVVLMRTTSYCGKPHDDAKDIMTKVSQALDPKVRGILDAISAGVAEESCSCNGNCGDDCKCKTGKEPDDTLRKYINVPNGDQKQPCNNQSSAEGKIGSNSDSKKEGPSEEEAARNVAKQIIRDAQKGEPHAIALVLLAMAGSRFKF